MKQSISYKSIGQIHLACQVITKSFICLNYSASPCTSVDLVFSLEISSCWENIAEILILLQVGFGFGGSGLSLSTFYIFAFTPAEQAYKSKQCVLDWGRKEPKQQLHFKLDFLANIDHLFFCEALCMGSLLQLSRKESQKFKASENPD